MAYRKGKSPSGFEALGDPTRWAIVELLAAEPRTVGEVAAELPVSRRHTRELRSVLTRRES